MSEVRRIMGKTAFIFPGQGAQVCGMGQDFYENSETAKAVFDRATKLLGFSVPELCFEKNDRLDITEYTQAAMVTTSVAMMKVMEERGIHADVAAGLSLGEYCALVAAGVMTADDAIRTVRERGILMQEAVPAGVGGMSAVLGTGLTCFATFISLRVTLSAHAADLPAAHLLRLHRYFHSRPMLSPCVPTVLFICGTGI